MKISFSKKLLIYFLLVFSIFTTIVLMIQRNREHVYKTDNLTQSLQAYSDVLRNQLIDTLNFSTPDYLAHLVSVIPNHVRVTFISSTGKVWYDSKIEDAEALENHLNRPEIYKAFLHGSGKAQRYSTSKKRDYFYYADYKNAYFIRMSVPMDKMTRDALASDDIFTYIIVFLFFVSIFLILYFADRFRSAISSLNDFIQSVENKNPNYDKIDFPDSELGELGNRVVHLYREIEEQEHALRIEKDKLLQHFQYSNEGIAIFEKGGTNIYANHFFIQYISFILKEPVFELSNLLDNHELSALKTFLKANTQIAIGQEKAPMYTEQISKEGRFFVIQLVVFEDESYELTLRDVTEPERTKQLKQQMTNNIAHELRTPVSGISGYLETVLMQDSISPEKMKSFLEKAYHQTQRLSDLIRDISLITKMEESSSSFCKADYNLFTLVDEVKNEFEKQLQEHHISFSNKLPPSTTIQGNETLLLSIFRNLVENSIKYAGDGVSIGVEQYQNDSDYVYIRYYDTGKGVETEYLQKIFERFYRINEGRSRKTGGSGLGLSIVRNAVLFHKGTITAKNYRDGGLEFLLTLKKHD